MTYRITKKNVESLLPTFCKIMELPLDRVRLDYAACYGGYRMEIAPIGKPYNVEHTINSSRKSIKEMYDAMHFAIDCKELTERLKTNNS